MRARVSPLWLFLPCAGFLLLLFRGSSTSQQMLALTLLVVQVTLSVWIIYRHRRWPWIAALLAAALLAWSGLGLAVYALVGTVP